MLDQVSFSLGCSHAGRCDTFVRGTQLSCGTRCRPLMPGWLHGGRLSWDGDSVVARLAALMPPCPLVCSTMHKVQPDLPHCNRNLHTCPLLSSRQFSCYRVYRGLHRLCLLASSFNYPIFLENKNLLPTVQISLYPLRTSCLSRCMKISVSDDEHHNFHGCLPTG